MPEISKTEWERALQTDEKSLASIREAIKTLKDGGKVENLSLANALSTEKALEAVIKNKKVLISKLADQQGAQGRLSNGAVAMNARQAFEQALRVQASGRTASIWNSSWHKVSVFSDGWAHEITVRRDVSPTGLTDDTSDKICKDLKADTIKGVDELLGKLKIKPAKIKPDAHVFLDGNGTNVRYSFLIGVYAKDDQQSAQLVEAFSHVVRK